MFAQEDIEDGRSGGQKGMFVLDDSGGCSLRLKGGGRGFRRREKERLAASFYHFAASLFMIRYGYSCTKATISPFVTMSPCFAQTATMRPLTAGTISSIP